MNKNQKTQVQEFFFKQGKKLIKSAGGIEALADRIKFKYGSLTIEDQNKLLYEGKESVKSMRQLAQKRFHSPIGDTIKSPQSELSQHLDKEHNDEDSDTEEHHDEDQHQEEVPMQAEAENGQYNDESDTPKADELDNLKKKIEEEPESVHEYPKDEED